MRRGKCHDLARPPRIIRRHTWFEGLQVTSDAGGPTVIAGPVADQAALPGLLAKIRDLNLPLISVRRI